MIQNKGANFLTVDGDSYDEIIWHAELTLGQAERLSQTKVSFIIISSFLEVNLREFSDLELRIEKTEEMREIDSRIERLYESLDLV